MIGYARADAETTYKLYKSMSEHCSIVESIKKQYRHAIKNKIKESGYSGSHRISGFTINLDNNTYKVHYGFVEHRQAIYSVAKEFGLQLID